MAHNLSSLVTTILPILLISVLAGSSVNCKAGSYNFDTAVENCNNGIDDDYNGKTDGEDDYCICDNKPDCPPEDIMIQFPGMVYSEDSRLFKTDTVTGKIDELLPIPASIMPYLHCKKPQKVCLPIKKDDKPTYTKVCKLPYPSERLDREFCTVEEKDWDCNGLTNRQEKCFNFDKTLCDPMNKEICNGKDDNCDGQIDEGCQIISHLEMKPPMSIDFNSGKIYDICWKPADLKIQGACRKIGRVITDSANPNSKLYICDAPSTKLQDADTNYFTVPMVPVAVDYLNQNGQWDYNCDGKIEMAICSSGTCPSTSNISASSYFNYNPTATPCTTFTSSNCPDYIVTHTLAAPSAFSCGSLVKYQKCSGPNMTPCTSDGVSTAGTIGCR